MANFFTRIPLFFREVKIEMTKVSWPTRKELVGASWIVLITTAILTTYIGVLDFLLSNAVTKIIQW
ncbi:MAG: preprotein translocase subunit SecE [Candidatus Omnitrophota bacterium]